ncbi:SDR family NAD(P)-dependent oxidoreductase [Streptomyces sp. NPDC097727]|uniref:SDR family NAD(P)-dependent oxidoreductase n=1 Tax=Streptomyces sp. NPDC097727 TaxID=3366092 RepID=UPI0037FEA662
MGPALAATAAHERLFRGRVSTLAVTDPELIEHFGNFASDEVLRHTGEVDQRTRLMTQLAAMIAVGAVAEYQVMIGAARTWLITGVSSGFGHALTTQLLERGDRDIGTVRDTGKATDLAEKYPDTFRSEILDVTDTAAVRKTVDQAFAAGRVDVIVSNAVRLLRSHSRCGRCR